VAEPGRRESPTEKLSPLTDQLNQRYGMNLGKADLVWFRQQKQAIRSDEQMRVVALNSDGDHGHVAQDGREHDRRPPRITLQRFNTFSEKPGFRIALIRYLAESYDEIRDEDAV
jgi:type I restriction enzyme R subunit